MHKLILFMDIGDTVIDEGTEVRLVPGGVVQRAEAIPGAVDAMLQLHAEGYTMAMVADGYDESFHNTMSQHGLDHIFAVRSLSEEYGVEKPAQVLFQGALDKLGLTDADKGRIVMVGNNVKRDILGAKRFGIRSVLVSWSPRYCMTPEGPEEVPDYEISSIRELPALIKKLDEALQ